MDDETDYYADPTSYADYDTSGDLSSEATEDDESDPFGADALSADEGLDASGQDSVLQNIDTSGATLSDNANDGVLTDAGTSLLSAIGNGLSAIGKAIGLASPTLAAPQLSQAPSSPFQALGLTTATGQLSNTGIMLAIAAVGLVLLTQHGSAK